jgi:hypothetical protein
VWYDIDKGSKTSDSSTSLYGIPTSSQLVAKQKELAKEINFALRSISFIHRIVFFTRHKILRHGANGFTFLPKKSVLLICIARKNPSRSAGFEPVNLASSGKHAKC